MNKPRRDGDDIIIAACSNNKHNIIVQLSPAYELFITLLSNIGRIKLTNFLLNNLVTVSVYRIYRIVQANIVWQLQYQ